MDRINDTPSGLKNSTIQCIVVRIWEIYLIRSRNNLRHLLSSYALDNGPLETNRTDADRISFRFTAYDWERSIIDMLKERHIPYEITASFTMEHQSRSTKKRVYVAEDDLNILFALNTMLEEAGYDVLLSHCAQPMLEPRLPATDVFILDKLMPGVNGIEVCKHLRKQASTKDVPVIMISASRVSAKEASDAGVTDVLEKPFRMNDLLKLVAKHTTGIPRQLQGV